MKIFILMMKYLAPPSVLHWGEAPLFSYWRPWLIASHGEYVNKSTLWGRKRDLVWPNIKCLSLPGCCNQIPPTRGLKQQTLFLIVLEVGSSGWECQHGTVLGEVPADGQLLPVSSHDGARERESKLSSYRGTKPMTGAGTRMTPYNLNITWEMVPQRHHLQIESHWGLGFNLGTFSP